MATKADESAVNAGEVVAMWNTQRIQRYTHVPPGQKIHVLISEFHTRLGVRQKIFAQTRDRGWSDG